MKDLNDLVVSISIIFIITMTVILLSNNYRYDTCVKGKLANCEAIIK